MQARRNFLINYTGREGSSAIISMLSAQKGVHVPLFEDLDAHELSSRHDRSDPVELMRKAFAEGRFDGIARHHALAPKARTEDDITGFKMRLRADAKDIAPVLTSHRVSYFVLSRRDFLEHLCSAWLSAREFSRMPGIGAEHPQFRLMNLNEDDREAARLAMDRLPVSPKVRELLNMATAMVRMRRKMSVLALDLQAEGVPVWPIYYEDFLADRIGFVRSVLTRLGFPPDWPIEDSVRLTKVLLRPAKSRFRGPKWLFTRMLLELDRQEYRKFQLMVDSSTRPV
jgi:hypothetical protein